MGKFATICLLLLSAVMSLCPPIALAQSNEIRLALVIEQRNYSGGFSEVRSATSEASAIAQALEEVGFDVRRVRNLGKQGLAAELGAFRGRIERSGQDAVGFVYYTGHGAQHPETGDSYLLGVDARMDSYSDLAVYGLDMKSQRDGFAALGAKAIFLVFDACRNIPPVSGYKANVKGLARVEAKNDMLIAYSTTLGDVAEEGTYAPILASEIVRSGQTAVTAFSNVQIKVSANTARRQRPWSNNQIYNSVCFAGCNLTASNAMQVPRAASRVSAAVSSVGGFDNLTIKDRPVFSVQPGGKGHESLRQLLQCNLSSQDASSYDDFRINVGDRVYLDPDSSELDSDDESILDQQAAWLIQNPGYKIALVGGTDERSSREYAMAKTQESAAAVASYLSKAGVSLNRVFIFAAGKEFPIAASSNEQSWALNRNVQTVLCWK